MFFRVDRKQNNISFDQGDNMVNRRGIILCYPLSGDKITEDCPGKIPQKVNFNNFPHKFQITRWVKEFKDTETLIMSIKKGQKSTSARMLTARSPENADAVRDSVGQNPKKSLWWCFQELGLSCSSIHKILKNDLQLYPYRIQIKQTLTQNDMAKRVEMCQWFQSTIEENPDFLQNVWFSEEAHFSLSGHVKSKNSVFWGSQAPDEVLLRPLHSVKCNAWVDILKHGIIGPFWFKNDVGEIMTVNKERYIVVLNKFWRTLCARCGMHQEQQ